MERRSFLKSAAKLLPATALPSFSLGQSPAPASTSAIHLVESGQDRFGETHSRGFSTILFKVVPSDTGGNLFVLEHAHLLKGGPPLHLHTHQEEYFYVMEGEVLFQIGDSRKLLHPGDSILGPRDIPHAFSSVGTTPGRMLITFAPAGKMEAFLRATAIPNPPKQDAAFFRDYEMELVGPPLSTS
jgi:quercetin dioxygenase-like cupin family protein